MQLIFPIFFFLVLIFIWLYKTPFPYTKISLSSINIFFYTLLYKGQADESIFQNANISVIESIHGKGIGLIKYKEKGETGIYLLMSISNLMDKKVLFLKKIKELNLDFFILKKGVFYEDHYLVDINRDITLLKNMLEFIWSQIYEADLVFELYLYDISNKISFNYYEFKRIRNDEITDLKIPLTKWQWILYKIKGKKTLLKSKL